jgi:ABC-type Zn uptake system ZnuABC Zn-binding protein ZnuA
MKRSVFYLTFLFISVLGIIGLMGCTSTVDQSRQVENDRLKIVATTTFIGDVISRIAADDVDLSIMLEPGQNPHSFHPTPRDLVLVSEADLIFVNGLGLEEFLDDLLAGADSSVTVVVVSDGIYLLESVDHEHESEEDDHEGEDHENESEGDSHQEHTGEDPHVWFDPHNIKVWVENITKTLEEMEPEKAPIYRSNAETFLDELDQLDIWIRDQVDQIPPQNRMLVTDHTTFGYFAEEYGFTQIGAMIPTVTTEAETSGGQLAELVDQIRAYKVKAIFVGIDTDPTLSERIAEETGVQLVPLYSGSLSDGDPAGTYLDFMRYNITQMVLALK